MSHRVILDTDPGVDDAMAIALCVTHPDIELLALTTVFGNVSVEQSTRNAQFVLDVFGATDVVVSKGLGQPLVLPPQAHSESVHGADGLGNCCDKTRQLNADAAHKTLHELPAPEFIIAQAKQNPGDITLIAVGPLTTHQIMVNDSQLASLRDGAGDTGKLLWESSRFYVDFYVKKGAAKDQQEPACAMHDAAAVPEAFDVVTGRSRVVDSGIAIGQLTCDRKGYVYSLPHWESVTGSTGIAMAVNSESVRQEFLNRLMQHHKT